MPADAMVLAALTHEKVGHTDQGLWHHKGLQLPAYIQHVANDLISERGMDESRAIATAVSRCKMWCATSKDPAVKGKACEAIAEWEALKTGATTAAAWNSAAHPRAPAGSATGGQFATGSTSAAPTNEKPVGDGEKGKRVSDLQKRLNALGFKLKVDGDFGPKTLAAVRAFQKARGLKVDGLVGPKTTTALRLHAGKPARKHAGKPARKPSSGPGGGKAPHAAAPAVLATIPGVEIVAAGTWQLASGRQTFTRDDLAHAVEAAGCPAVGNPLIKIGHLDKRFTPGDGEPALGRVTNMRTDGSGMKLVGDLAGMPGWLASISASAFPRRSIEGSYDFQCQVGHKHPFVITALALLGQTQPGVGVLSDLKDLANLFYRASARDPGTKWRTGPIEQTGGNMPVTEEDVRRAYYAGAGVPQTWWISELQMSPSQLIVTDDEGRMFQVPFAIQGSAVSFGDANEVRSYADLAASRGSGPSVVFASAGESRWVSDEGDGDEGDEGDEIEVDDIDESWDDLSDLPDLSELSIGDFETAATGAVASAEYVDALTVLAAALSTGDRFAALESALQDSGARNPGALAAWIGRKQYDKAEFLKLAAACPPGAGDGHVAMSGTHAHAHPAYGSQGGDATHAHTHTHSGDAVHDHAHGTQAGAGNTEGASEVDFTDEQKASLRASLGLEDDQELTPERIVSGYKGRITAAARRVGGGASVEIDKGEWEAINARVKAAEDYQARQKVKERDQVIASAVRDGKFSAARKPHYVRAWDADPEGARELIASLQKNVVPVSDVGSPGGTEDELLEDEYKSLFPPGSVKTEA